MSVLPLKEIELSTPLALWLFVLGLRKVRAQVVILALLAGVLLALRAPVAHAFAMLAVGAVCWVFYEYPLHRYVLHIRPPVWASERLVNVLDRLHASHHREPDDPNQVVFGLLGVFVFQISAGLLGFALGHVEGALACALGMGLMLLNYQVMHIGTHARYSPRTRWFRLMRRGHLAHHRSREAGCYGLTTPLLDVVCQTWHPDA